MSSRNTSNVPHSWSVELWPPTVWPGSPSRGRYVTRAFRDALIAEGALARVGRELIVFGDRYTRFLQRRAVNVPGYEIAANRAAPPEAPAA